MLKKIILGIILTSSLFGENELWKFFKYSTAYGSFSLNAPRYQDDRFAIVGGLSSGILEVKRTERELKPDFQKDKIDHYFDPLIRAIAIVKAFECNPTLKETDKRKVVQNSMYFVIHPVLKHIAILK